MDRIFPQFLRRVEGGGKDWSIAGAATKMTAEKLAQAYLRR
jgi:hypothetical protein